VAQGKEPDPVAVNDKTLTGMRLIELDGRRDGPIDRGECTDLLSVSARSSRSRIHALSMPAYIGRREVHKRPIRVNVYQLELQLDGADCRSRSIRRLILP
jgi:hypothetical protein